MEDTLLSKTCSNCGTSITLMESCRGDDPSTTYLVERCLKCGGHPVVEVARLAEDQSDLNN